MVSMVSLYFFLVAMMGKSYAKAKGRASTGRFLLIPHRCLDHENYIRLSSKAVKLLIDIAMQFNGRNNGDLTAALSVLKKRGWKSSETLRLALDELLHYGWIVVTRKGGLNRTTTLYALTFHPIDECKGKLDVNSTAMAPRNWNQTIPKWEKPITYKEIDIRRATKRNEKNCLFGIRIV